MAVSKSQKVEMLAQLDEVLKGSESVVFVNFHGLSITQEQEMREKLKEEGIRYFVAKKTLINRALDASSVVGERPPFEGELALAYGQDPIAPAREVYAFVKKSDGALSIRGGIYEGGYKNAEEMTAIALIPGMLELRGMFVNLINSPIQGLAVALNAIAEKRA